MPSLRPHSLRVKITTVAGLVIVLALAAVSLVLVGAVKHHLVRQVDQELTRQVDFYRPQLTRHSDIPPVVSTDLLGQTLAPDGSVISTGSRLEGKPPLISRLPAGLKPSFANVNNPTFGRLRVVSQRVSATNDRIMVDAEQIDQVLAAQRSLTRRLATIMPLLAIALTLLVWLVLRRAFTRVDEIRATVAEISDRNLGERLPVSVADDEIARLANTMNQMLERIDVAVRRQRRFIADASHELRTPVASLRAALETSGRDRATLQQSHDVALRALHRLDDLVDALLVLDSAGQPQSAQRSAVDVDDVVFVVVSHLSSLTPLDLDISEVSAGQVLATEVALVRIVENLAMNAIRHANTRVAFSVLERDGRVRVAVSDDGPGVPPGEHTRIFERFTRVGQDRGRNDGGAGLGLAIVADLVQQLDGRVWVDDVAPHGARFVVELPALLSEPWQATGLDPSRRTPDFRLSLAHSPDSMITSVPRDARNPPTRAHRRDQPG